MLGVNACVVRFRGGQPSLRLIRADKIAASGILTSGTQRECALFDGLYEGRARCQVLIGHIHKFRSQLFPMDARLIDDSHIADDMKTMSLQLIDVSRMRLSVEPVWSGAFQISPRFCGIGPMSVPLSGEGVTTKVNLMGHNPSRL